MSSPILSGLFIMYVVRQNKSKKKKVLLHGKVESRNLDRNKIERDSSTLVKDDYENKNSNSDYPQLLVPPLYCTYPKYSPQSLASL